jgi:hypothetical protein
MDCISDYVVRLVKSLPKEPVDFTKPVVDQIDYEDHEKIVNALYNGIKSGYVAFYSQVWDLRQKCDEYVIAVMTNDARLNPNLNDTVESKPNEPDFILNQMIDSLNNTDPESLLFDQIERAIERRKKIISSRVSETNLK